MQDCRFQRFVSNLNMLGSFRLFLQVDYDSLITEEITQHQA